MADKQPPKPVEPSPLPADKNKPTPQDEYIQQLLVRLALSQPDVVAKIINQWLSEDQKRNG